MRLKLNIKNEISNSYDPFNLFTYININIYDMNTNMNKNININLKSIKYNQLHPSISKYVNTYMYDEIIYILIYFYYEEKRYIRYCEIFDYESINNIKSLIFYPVISIIMNRHIKNYEDLVINFNINIILNYDFDITILFGNNKFLLHKMIKHRENTNDTIEDLIKLIIYFCKKGYKLDFFDWHYKKPLDYFEPGLYKDSILENYSKYFEDYECTICMEIHDIIKTECICKTIKYCKECMKKLKNKCSICKNKISSLAIIFDPYKYDNSNGSHHSVNQNIQSTLRTRIQEHRRRLFGMRSNNISRNVISNDPSGVNNGVNNNDPTQIEQYDSRETGNEYSSFLHSFPTTIIPGLNLSYNSNYETQSIRNTHFTFNNPNRLNTTPVQYTPYRSASNNLSPNRLSLLQVRAFLSRIDNRTGMIITPVHYTSSENSSNNL